MRIAVMGAGAVGGYFGALLARAREDVTLLARGAHLGAIQREGLRIESIRGEFTVRPPATDDPTEVGPVDLVLLATKTYHVPQAAEQMQPLLGEETLILPLMNGVVSAEQLSKRFGERVLGGTTWIFSERTAPGVVEHSGYGRIDFGELAGGITPRTQAIEALFTRAGVDHTLSEDVNVNRWRKFITVGPYSGVAAVTRATTGELLSMPETKHMWLDAMYEYERVGRAMGVRLPRDIVKRTMEFVEGWPPDSTPSMARDIQAGLPSELDAQTGYIAKRGTELEVSVPVNTFIYHALLPQERRAQST